MKILVAEPTAVILPRFLRPAIAQRLEACGDLRWNAGDKSLSRDELRSALAGCVVAVTGWGTPKLDAVMLTEADELKLVVHLGGTVASVASRELYHRGVQICSGNQVMARFVAEGILAYLLSSLREIPHFHAAIARGESWPRDPERLKSLYGAAVGFVGLGTVGRCLLPLLQPFAPTIRVFDPYAPAEALTNFPGARLTSLEEVLAESEVVSLHASLTEETHHLLDRRRLALLPNNALLINAARGAIIDEAALQEELARGRLRAALDVYAEEPLSVSSPLRTMKNVILGPHQAGAPCYARLGEAMVEEVERFKSGRPLHHLIPEAQFERMTRPVPNGR